MQIVVIIVSAAVSYAWRILLVAAALGAAVVVESALTKPGEQPFADNPRVVEAADPLSSADARQADWPTRRDDSEFGDGFMVFLGSDLVWPSWVSCEDRICLVGSGDDVLLYDAHPRFARVGAIDASLGENPFEKLIASTVSEEQARRLLTP